MTGSIPTVAPVFHRRLVLDASDAACVAAVEDAFHHFVVTLEHAHRLVTVVAARAPRTPWSLCGEAVQPLQRFVGQALDRRVQLAVPGIDSKQQCTHQFDLAVLALSHGVTLGRSEFHAVVRDDADGAELAQLWRDGELVLDWRVRQGRVDSACLCDGRDLRTILSWAGECLDDDALQALYVLRRAVMVSAGRRADLDRFSDAGQLMARMAGACHVFKPERASQALRHVGSTRMDICGPAQLLTEFGVPPPYR